jgi:hypothetical protein
MKKSKIRRGRRRLSPSRPRKPKTLEQVCAPAPNEFHFDFNTGIYLTLEPVRLWTLGELLNKFYDANHELNPIAWEQVEDHASSITEKDWYAIMYRGWHIRIIKGYATEGPHQTQLWFKTPGMTCPPRSIWIATLQLMGFFFNSDEIKANLLAAIANREFFMSDSDRDSTTQI